MTQEAILSQEDMDCVIEDARFGDLDSLKEIFAELDASSLLNIKDEFTLSTTIHMAAANGHSEVIEYLLSLLPEDDAKKLSNTENESGNTPLHWASLNGHLKAVEVLCNYEADPFLKNKAGHDSIFEAERNNKTDVENWFLKKFSVEDDYDESEASEIKYQPGSEIAAATKESLDAVKDLQEQAESLKI